MTIQYGGSRKYGFSVRLVQAAPLTYPIALSAVTADYIGSVVTSDGNVYPAKTAVPAGKTAVSNWAVAQKSDYEAIFTNLGSTQSDGFNGTTYDDNVNDYITTGVDGLAILGFYWSATEESDYNESWNFYNYCWTTNGKSTSYNVRPVLGF